MKITYIKISYIVYYLSDKKYYRALCDDLYVFKVKGSRIHGLPLYLSLAPCPDFLTYVSFILQWAELLNRSVDLDEILYGGDGITSTTYYLIPQLQPFQNGGRLNF
jgi:hypothetical protein